MSGDLGIYDADARIIDQKEIRPGQTKYEVSVPVDAKKSYYVRIRASSGSSGYELSTDFSDRDPCASCPSGTRCSNGKCVDVASRRDPCGGRCIEGFECDFNTLECVSMPCGGRCTPGQTCDESRDRCVDEEDECRQGSDCNSGEQCSRGKCVRKAAKVAECSKDSECSNSKICKRGKCVRKPECSSSSECSGGKECKKGKCVAPAADEKSGPVKGSIVSVQAGAKGTILTLSVPSGHGIKRGATGKVVGLPAGGFVVTKVAGSRVQGRMTRIKSREGVGNNRKVVIYP